MHSPRRLDPSPSGLGIREAFVGTKQPDFDPAATSMKRNISLVELDGRFGDQCFGDQCFGTSLAVGLRQRRPEEARS